MSPKSQVSRDKINIIGKIFIIFLIINSLIAIIPLVSFAIDNIPVVSRDSIINYAKSGVGSPYVWGGDTWNPSNKKWGGADCSGFVAKSWMVPKKVEYTQSLGHPYTTASFYSQTTHWYSINRSEMAKGDAFVRRDSTGGHIMIYEKGDPWGQVTVYEAKGKAWGIIHDTRDPLGSNYKAIRRNNLSDIAPQIIASAKLPNGSYVAAQPASWAQNKMFFDNTDALNDFYVSNVLNSEVKKSLFIQNSKASLHTSFNVGSYRGLSFSRSIQGNNNSRLLRHASGWVISNTGTIASEKSRNGYIYQAVPKQFVNNKLGFEYFRTVQDVLYLTNPISKKVRVKVYLYSAGRLIAFKQVMLNPLQVRTLNWKRNKKVIARSRNVYMEIQASRSIMASRRLPTSSYEQARPLKFASNRLYLENFNPHSEAIYLANPSSKVTANVTVTLFNDSRSLYSISKKIRPRSIIGINLNKTQAKNYQDTGVKIISRGSNIIGSRRLKTGHFQVSFSQSMLSQNVLLERYDPAIEPLFVTNPNQSSVSLQIKFYNKGILIFTKNTTVKGEDCANLNFSSEPSLQNYHELLVQMTSGY